MRTALSVVLFLLIISLVFSGCVKETTVIHLTEFESTVQITKDDFKINGKLAYKNPDEMTFTVTEPTEIENTVVVYSYGQISLKCDDLTFDITNICVGKDVFSPLFEALEYIGKSEPEVKNKGVNNLNLAEKGMDLVFSSDEMRIVSVLKDGISYSFKYA